MATYATPQKAYQESSVLTASPEQLVVMLYDGVNRFLLQAAAAMRAGQIEAAHNRLRRAEAIIDELHATLDLSQGQMAERLQGIYVFCRRLLNEARSKRNAARIEQVAELLGELREAWAQIAA
jgi:flagellar secretion chaperone FliS